ncbi:hypothetical protein BBK_5640 [Burkholderia pseudomallei NCTC 13179]|nr:hypothetical protein BBK_5640 [Burkholderia pseudomallei NCTC 13179]
MSARGGRMHDVPAGASPYPAFARSRRLFRVRVAGMAPLTTVRTRCATVRSAKMMRV